MSMNPIPVKSPEVKGAIERTRAKLAAEEAAKQVMPDPGTAQWPKSTTYVAMKRQTAEAAARKAAMPALPPKPPTRVQRLNQLVADHTQRVLHERGEVSIPELDTQITAALVRALMEHPDEMLAVAEAAIRPTIHGIVTRTLQKNGVQIQGETAITIDTLRARVKVRSEAVRWLEWDPTSKTYIPLHDMTRRQLMDAAVTHSLESREHQEVSRWFLNMADRMDDADLTVGKAFDDDEIIRLRGLASTPSPVGHRDRE